MIGGLEDGGILGIWGVRVLEDLGIGLFKICGIGIFGDRGLSDWE